MTGTQDVGAEFRLPLRVIENDRIPMREGARLPARLRPAEQPPVPKPVDDTSARKKAPRRWGTTRGKLAAATGNSRYKSSIDSAPLA